MSYEGEDRHGPPSSPRVHPGAALSSSLASKATTPPGQSLPDATLSKDLPATPPQTATLQKSDPSKARPRVVPMDMVGQAFEQIQHSMNETMRKEAADTVKPRVPLSGSMWGGTGPQLLPPPVNVALCGVARRYSNTTADCITTIRREMLRKGIEVYQKFVRRCDKCDMDYDNEVEKCEICGGDVREPDRKQELLAEKWKKRANENGEALTALVTMFQDDIETFDDGFFVMRYDYTVGPNGEVIEKKLLEVIRGIPGRILFIVDEAFNRRGYLVREDGSKEGFFTCVIHREKNMQRDDNKPCQYCGRPLVPCEHAALDEHNQPNVGYIKGEIVHRSDYIPTETFGHSPIMTNWTPIMTLVAMDVGQYYLYANDRPPKGMLILNTDNPESMWAELRKQDADMKNNPQHIYKIAVQSQSRSGGGQWIPITPSMAEMENLGQRQDLYQRLWSTWGVEPIFMADVSSGGGLNNEGRQLTVSTRKVDTIHMGWHEDTFPKLEGGMGLTDYGFRFPDPLEKDKQAVLMRRQQNLQLRMMIEQYGGETEVIDDEDWDFVITDQPDFMMGGMDMGMGPGGPEMGGSATYGEGGSYGQMREAYGGEEEPYEKADFEALVKVTARERSFYKVLVEGLQESVKSLSDNWEVYKSPQEKQILIDAIVSKAIDKMENATVQDLGEALLAGMRETGANPHDMGIDPQAITAIVYDSPVWASYAKMGQTLSDRINLAIERSYVEPSKMTSGMITKRLTKMVAEERWKLQRIARTETGHIQNVGREMGWRQRDPDGENLYKWQGRIDYYPDGKPRTCEAHRTLITETAARPLPLEAIKARVAELAKEHMGAGWEVRDWVIHPNQRGRLVRVVL